MEHDRRRRRTGGARSLGCSTSLLLKQRRLADESNTFPLTHSFLVRHHGCRLFVRQRDATSRYSTPESATKPLHVPSLSFFDSDVRRPRTNHGIPLAGGSATGRTERVQESVRLLLCCISLTTLSVNFFHSQPWMIVPQLVDESPTPLDRADVQVPLSAQQQNSGTNAESKPISIPRAHLHLPRPTQGSTSVLSSDLPPSTDPDSIF